MVAKQKGKNISQQQDTEQTQSKQTSRQRVLDLVEAIVNQIQLASHLQELLDGMELTEENIHEYAEISLILNKAIQTRRDMMELLGGKNMDYWCAVKHALASWGYAQEVLYANKKEGDKEKAKKFKEVYDNAQQIAFMTLSKFLGFKLMKCGRCLNDALSNDALSNETV